MTPIISQSHLVIPSMPSTPLNLQKHNYRIKSTLIIVSCIILLAFTAGYFLNPNRFIIAKNDHASTSDVDNHRYPQKFETHSSAISNPPVFVVPSSPTKSSHRTGTLVEPLPTSMQIQEPTQSQILQAPAVSQQPQISQAPAVSQQPQILQAPAVSQQPQILASASGFAAAANLASASGFAAAANLASASGFTAVTNLTSTSFTAVTNLAVAASLASASFTATTNSNANAKIIF